MFAVKLDIAVVLESDKPIPAAARHIMEHKIQRFGLETYEIKNGNIVIRLDKAITPNYNHLV